MTCRSKGLLLFLLLGFIPDKLFAQEITFVTEDQPPFQIKNQKEPPSGAFVELVNTIIETAGVEASIKIYPWARSYELALTRPNTFIFSLLRNADRETKFHWIGQIFTVKSYLVSLKSRTDITLENIDDAKNYSVGAIRHYAAVNYLIKKGFTLNKNLYKSSKSSTLWHGLYSGRTDLALINSSDLLNNIAKSGLDPSQIQVSLELPDFPSDIYIAANLGTEKSLVDKISKSLELIKADGRYQQILTKWQLTPP